MPTSQPPAPQDASGAEQAGVLAAVWQALRSFAAAARDAILGARSGAPDLDQWPDSSVWLAAVTDTIGPSVRDVFRAAFRRSLPSTVDISDQAWVHDYLDTLPNRLSGVSDEAYDLVRTALHAGLDDGDTPQQLRQRVADAVDMDTGGEWQWRAERIARTEANTASQAGRYSAASARSQATGEPVRKQWWTSMDSRVRPTHRASHGQVVTLSESFRVGASRMRFPGDPLGPPNETVQCRCQLLILWPGDQPVPADTPPMAYGEAA